MLGTSLYCNPVFVHDLISRAKMYGQDNIAEAENADDECNGDLCSPLAKHCKSEDGYSTGGESEESPHAYHADPVSSFTTRCPSFEVLLDDQSSSEEESTFNSLEVAHELEGIVPDEVALGFPLPPAPAPRRSCTTMEDIAKALRAQPDEHPFLNMSYQLAVREGDRQAACVTQRMRTAGECMLKEQERNQAIKILLREAHRHHMRWASRRPAEQAANGLSPAEIDRQWSNIAMEVERALHIGCEDFIQRRLSCMCMFNSQVDHREYSDNDELRLQKMNRQREVLERLHQQAIHGGDKFFLSTAL